jgi:hypothetical protein
MSKVIYSSSWNVLEQEPFILLNIVKFILPSRQFFFSLCNVSPGWHSLLTNGKLIGKLWTKCEFIISITTKDTNTLLTMINHNLKVYLTKQNQLGPENVPPLTISCEIPKHLILNREYFTSLTQVNAWKLKDTVICRVLDPVPPPFLFVNRIDRISILQIESNVDAKETTLHTMDKRVRELPGNKNYYYIVFNLHYIDRFKSQLDLSENIIVRHTLKHCMLVDEQFPSDTKVTVIDDNDGQMCFMKTRNVTIQTFPYQYVTNFAQLSYYLRNKFPVVNRLRFFGDVWNLTSGNRVIYNKPTDNMLRKHDDQKLGIDEVIILGSDVPDIFKDNLIREITDHMNVKSFSFEGSIQQWKQISFNTTDVNSLLNIQWKMKRIKNLPDLISEWFDLEIRFKACLTFNLSSALNRYKMDELNRRITDLYNAAIMKDFSKQDLLSHTNHWNRDDVQEHTNDESDEEYIVLEEC